MVFFVSILCLFFCQKEFTNLQQLVCKYLLIIVSLLLAKCSTSVIVKKGRVKETKSEAASSLAPTIAPENPYDRGVFF